MSNYGYEPTVILCVFENNHFSNDQMLSVILLSTLDCENCFCLTFCTEDQQNQELFEKTKLVLLLIIKT